MNLVVRRFDVVDYEWSLKRMRARVDSRDDTTADELWFLQHHPVFTQGQGGRAVHVLEPGDIPVVQSDRGGQVTFHGPGQLIVYIMMDLRRAAIGPRELVRRIESGIIAMLGTLGVTAARRTGAPGVYVEEAKIAALGLRIRRGISYHGLSLNVDVDLEPFTRIDPCGYRGLAVTRLRDLGITVDCAEAARLLLSPLVDALYTGIDDIRIERRPGSGVQGESDECLPEPAGNDATRQTSG